MVCCAECWAEADRTKVEFGTAEDLLKAKSCVEGGDPTLLAVREGDQFKLYQLATGKFRLPGKNWLEFVGKRIAVEGSIQPRKEISIIKVDKVEVLAPSVAEREAAKIVGQQKDLALKDLKNGQVDGVVVDFPTAFYGYADVVVGQFSDIAGEQEQFGLTFEKGSPLVECVNLGIEALREDGTLDDLKNRWLEVDTSVPTFT